MKLSDLPGYLRDTAFRLLPHRARTGLFPIGDPGPDAPVLVTGNFTLTVRRLREALAGQAAWVLVVNSKGYNVWCAAGGGHLTHHDVISAMRVTHLADKVRRREVILPQLAATGVERRAISAATGFATRWGPARLEDLPAFLGRGSRVFNAERFMRFPAWERQEMAAIWYVPALIVLAPAIWLMLGPAAALAAAFALVSMVAALFAMLPRFNPVGPRRLPILLGFGLAGALAGWGLLAAMGDAMPWTLVVVGATNLIGTGLLFMDLAGTTPWYPSVINTGANPATITLDEARCDGSGDCVMVCPRQVLKMNGSRRKVEIRDPGQCIQCGACIVQCPRDALLFHYADGSTVEAPTIRNTRLNMLGKRREVRR
ncbi:hypothetical protein U879_03690 [Defluviimonas sp. 20V17]|uniref:4Fe-4S dicluster domain-containing protein n=1 Tax=Allgaiera indica TaxID=765699 RepID=A0AAN4UUF0_9RHOB|nr:HgcAB-like fusion protein [Allgaiera indica]KDB05028.1 hypothetical protein U879_03690 [Defluviimonas sp. 20V17]GHE05504.1 hypothetical protein GCM10008024_36610 [Allgaiera indica]SDX70244.1 4Fe-4S dicluster domain-containing protein [Allgaiera indica]